MSDGGLWAYKAAYWSRVAQEQQSIANFWMHRAESLQRLYSQPMPAEASTDVEIEEPISVQPFNTNEGPVDWSREGF